MRKIVMDILQAKGVKMDEPSLGIHVVGYFSGDQQDITFTFDRLGMPELCARMCRDRDKFPNDMFPYHPYIDELANVRVLPENLVVPVTKLLLIVKNDKGTMIVVRENPDERGIKSRPDPFSWRLPGTGGMEVNSFFGSAIEKFQQEQVFLEHEEIVKTEDFQPVDWLPGLSKIRFVDEHGVSSKNETVIRLNDVKTEDRTSLVIVPAVMKGPFPGFRDGGKYSGMYGVSLDDLVGYHEFVKDKILRTLLTQHAELLKQLAS